MRALDGKALKVWTGSTNWALTGLCTQVNNGILIENEEISEIYLDQWQKNADAGNSFTKALVESNAKSPRICSNVDVWFTRVRNTSKKNTDLGFDLQALVDLVNGDKQMILYIMFEPGTELLGNILKRASDISVNGVASTVLPGTAEKFELMGVNKNSSDKRTALVQPEGLKEGFSSWINEVTRAQFLGPSEIGHAITHSKIIVIDPFSENCKVITGSHNFSKSASEKNDENFIVIHGNRDPAEAYAVECLATYDHYRWRAYVKETVDAGKKVWSQLSNDPKWQMNYLSAERKKHLDIWCR